MREFIIQCNYANIIFLQILPLLLVNTQNRMFCKSVFESPQHFIALACDLFDYPELGVRQLESLLLKARSPSISLQYSVQFLKEKSIQSLALTICRFTSQLSDLSQGSSMSTSLQRQLSQSSLLTEVRHQITHGQMPSYQTIIICKQIILKNLQQKYWRAKIVQYCQGTYLVDWTKVEAIYKRIYQKEYQTINEQSEMERKTILNFAPKQTQTTNLFQAYKGKFIGDSCKPQITAIKNISSLSELQQLESDEKQMFQYIYSKFQVSQGNALKRQKYNNRKSRSSKKQQKQKQYLENQPKQLSNKVQLVSKFTSYKMKQYFQQHLKITCQKQKCKYSKTNYKIQVFDIEKDLKMFYMLFPLINNFQRRVLLTVSLNQFSQKPSSQFLYRLISFLFKEIESTVILNEPLILNKLKKLRFLYKIGKCQRLFNNAVPKQLNNQVEKFWALINQRNDVTQ